MAGDAGTDALNFNGSNIGEELSLVANGTHARFLRNVAAIDMDLAAVEQVNVRTLGGADTMTVGDLAGTGVRGVNVDLTVVRRQRRRRGRPRDRQRHRRAGPRRAQHGRDDGHRRRPLGRRARDGHGDRGHRHRRAARRR